jgi:5,10-methylenetetrahydromethanopterin reductase
LRLGLRVSGHRTAAEAVRLAVAAEHAGVQELWLTEDYLERGIFAVAGAVAGATSDVTIGLGVVNPFSRHPGLIAMEVAALDEIAGGRVVLALGGSNERWMSDWLGIDFAKPLGAVREARRVIDDLLSTGAADFAGERFSVHARMVFQPTHRTPIWYGVKGPRGLDAARTDADGVVLSVLSSPSYVRWVRDIVGDGVTLAAFVEVALSGDAATARDSVRPFVARFLGMHGDQPITREAGLDAEAAGRFRAALLAGTPDVAAVTDDVLNRFVVAGDLADCVAGFHRFADAGLHTLIVGDRPDEPIDAVVDSALSCWTAAGFPLA